MNTAAAMRDPTSADTKSSSWSRFVSLFAHNHLGNLLFVTMLLIGFFHGWMKLRYRGMLTTFAFDIPLLLSLSVTLAQVPRMEAWIPAGRMGSALKAFLVLAVFYMVLPFGVPWVAIFSAFRGWCFIPLTFLLGYHLVRSVRQVEVYFWIIILLGAVTGIYGAMQTPEEIRRRMAEDAEFAAKFFNTFYANSKGEARLRAFSTFVSAAAFGGTMAYTVMFAVSRFSVAGNSWKERIILLACAAPMAYGIILSGSRTSMVMMAMGLILTAWYRRNILQYILAPAVAFIAFKVGSIYTGGDSLNRFSTLINPDEIYGRLYIVIYPMMSALVDAPFGGGLGMSGHGVPYALINQLGGFRFRGVDGDIGRLGVDMGIIGIGVFLWLLIAGALDAYRNMKELRDTPLTIVGVPAGAMFIIAVIILPTGSPFLAIPGGALLWFFLGALERLTVEYRKREAITPETVRTDAMFISFIQPPKTRLLFSEDKAETKKAAAAAPRSRVIQTAPVTRRFLFSRTDAENKALADRRAALRRRRHVDR